MQQSIDTHSNLDDSPGDILGEINESQKLNIILSHSYNIFELKKLLSVRVGAKQWGGGCGYQGQHKEFL